MFLNGWKAASGAKQGGRLCGSFVEGFSLHAFSPSSRMLKASTFSTPNCSKHCRRYTS